jgi:putative redox protein
MKITLKSDKKSLNYIGINERNQKLKLSGNKTNVSPMESLLMAAAACSAIDIETMLKKMRQPLENIEVLVEGKRREELPNIFVEVKLYYRIFGNVKESKAKEAVYKSVKVYCSVLNMIEKSAEVIYSFEVIPTTNE